MIYLIYAVLVAVKVKYKTSHMGSKTKKDALLVKVGQRIQEMRLEAGLRQEDLEDYGISWKHYQRIEAGTTNTTIRFLYKIAKAFKCNVCDLLP